MTPNARSLKLLRELGYRAYIVERWNSFACVRQDFAGFADLLAFKTGSLGVLAVQSTTRRNQSARMVKLLTLPQVDDWLAAGNRIEIHGWGKVGARGKRKLWDVAVQLVEKY